MVSSRRYNESGKWKVKRNTATINTNAVYANAGKHTVLTQRSNSQLVSVKPATSVHLLPLQGREGSHQYHTDIW